MSARLTGAEPSTAGAGEPRRAASRRRSLSPHTNEMGGYLMLLLDPLCFFAAAWLALQLCVQWPPAAGLGEGFAGDAASATWAAALLSPFLLFNGRFGMLAAHAPLGRLLRAHGQRLLLLGLLLFVLAAVSGRGRSLPVEWIAAWLAFALAGTALTRATLVHLGRRLARQGRLTESVAVVGAGPVARRFVARLQAAQPRSLELLGVFDDDPGPAGGAREAPDGRIADLLTLGITRRIDWIVLTLPPGDEAGVRAMVHRLKSLSAPIALCPKDMRNTGIPHVSASIGQVVAVELLLPDGGLRRGGAEPTWPRWLATLAELSGVAGRALARRFLPAGRPMALPRAAYRFDAHDLQSVAGVAATFGHDRYGFVVTPNADHLVRLHEDADFRAHYAAADYFLLDSRFVAHALRVTRHLDVPVCTGSDLTAHLFGQVMSPSDVVVLIGASATQAQTLRDRHGLQRLEHFAPPMGFIHDPVAVEDCLQFIERHSPFRFCLLAVGSPQQEALASLLRSRGRARGLALCIGASIDFLTGHERRAPPWMQAAGLEWLYRLQQSPRRLAHRYLVRGPRVFAALRGATIELRPRAASDLAPPSPLHPDVPR